MRKNRIAIIGGVAGGATAAARIMRLDPGAQVTLFERGPDISFANCGLPYFIGREIKDRSKLSMHTAQSLRAALGIDVRINTEVVEIDPNNRQLKVRATTSHFEEAFTYDSLIYSPGVNPIRPPAAQGFEDRILTLRDLSDMDRIDALVHSSGCKRICVIGAGFIGLEMVEQLHRISDKEIYLVERSPAVLPQADEEIASFLHQPLASKGVHILTGDEFTSFTRSDSGGIVVHLKNGTPLNVDLVILSIGISPESKLARNAGIEVNQRGYVVVNEFMQTSVPSIYAVGDAIETQDLVFPALKTTIALGNIANMQARIAADHIIRGSSIPYRGSLGTSIVRVFDTVVALTGWNEKRLKTSNIPYQTATITADSHASYYPGGFPITLKITYDPETGRLFGAQAVGIDGVDKRIDAIAAAISGKLTIDDLSLMQLCYSPPFGSARDVVNIAGLAARNIRENLVTPAYTLSHQENGITLDVRPEMVAKLSPINGAINIPYAELAQRSSELDQEKPLLAVCNLGKTSYFASRILRSIGFSVSSLVGGLRVHRKPTPALQTSSHLNSNSAPKDGQSSFELDCSGLCCPGPLLKLKEALDKHPGSICHVTSTDAGFEADIQAFANSKGFKILSLATERGTTKASIDFKSVQLPTQTTRRQGATLVVFSQDMDKILGAFVIANGAAALGGEVTMFFTFWGINALRRSPAPATKKSFIDWAFGWMMPCGKDSLPLSNMNFGGLGALLMKYTMKQKSLPNLAQLMMQAKDLKIKLVACTMSMEAMGIQKEELIEGVNLGGVAEYLSAAEQTGTNLFI